MDEAYLMCDQLHHDRLSWSEANAYILTCLTSARRKRHCLKPTMSSSTGGHGCVTTVSVVVAEVEIPPVYQLDTAWVCLISRLIFTVSGWESTLPRLQKSGWNMSKFWPHSTYFHPDLVMCWSDFGFWDLQAEPWAKAKPKPWLALTWWQLFVGKEINGQPYHTTRLVLDHFDTDNLGLRFSNHIIPQSLWFKPPINF